MKKKAVIIGAGPAGLTAAYELLDKTNIQPIIYESSSYIGGISKTINYKGNRMDLGGHRFFSKSDEVMRWWENILPLQRIMNEDCIEHEKNAPDPEKTDKVMLIRNRLSRIFFSRKFFDYPVSLNFQTISNLGALRLIKIAISYAKIKLFPIRHEKSLEDFFINRFGKELYLIFFKDYTEKVWGLPCSELKPDWGSQRVKGLSLIKAVAQSFKNSKNSPVDQKNTETSLISKFLYPKFGPGQLWEEVARIIEKKGGKIYLNHKMMGLQHKKNKITEIKAKDEITGKIKNIKGDFFFSSMPVRDLIQSFKKAPEPVLKVANGLVYRDFITVGLLLKKMSVENKAKIKAMSNIVPDNWIYIQEKDVKLGRVQIFNNWSPYMVKNKNLVWLGLEYFCNEGDELWSKSKEDFIEFASDELVKIGFAKKEDVLDGVVVKTLKAYPSYVGTYDGFDVIREFTDRFENLFLIGRNGMHKYNNQDHSMLSAMAAVRNIAEGIKTKDNIWAVNAEKEYHEEKQEN